MRARDSFRRYGSIRILRDGRVRFSPWIFPGLRYLSFIVGEGSASVEISSRTILFLYLTRNHVTSACFPYDLSSDELRSAVADLLSAGRGLERWIVPGLEFTQKSSSLKDRNPKLVATIRELLDTHRDLPVAETWQRTRRRLREGWEQWLREHPEDLTKVPAPWLLPDGSKARGTGKGQAKRRR